MPLKEKYYSKIEEIIESFGLYNKGDYSNPKEYLYKSPKITLAELVIKYKKKEITESEINSFLEERLDLSKEKVKKLKNTLEDKLLKNLNNESVIFEEKGNRFLNKNSDKDRYREPIE